MRARRAGAALFLTKGEISDDIKGRSVFQRHLQALFLGHELAPLTARAAAMKNLPSTMRDAGRVLVIDDDAGTTRVAQRFALGQCDFPGASVNNTQRSITQTHVFGLGASSHNERDDPPASSPTRTFLEQ